VPVKSDKANTVSSRLREKLGPREGGEILGSRSGNRDRFPLPGGSWGENGERGRG